ncbi:Glycosyltransferase [Minicystis rosea]|nr:Glycosyltransferase [Minicystis rosea]
MKPIRIGVLSLSSPDWTAGASFTRVLLGALARRADPVRERVVLIASDDSVPAPPGVETIRVPAADLSLPGKARRQLLRVRDRYPALPGEWPLRSRLHIIEPSDPIHLAKLAGVDVVLPALRGMPRGIGIGQVGWIPDFQHRHLPQFFNREEIAQRDASYRDIAERSDRVILSSHDVASHFAAIYPREAHKVRVASFPSLFTFDPPRGDVASAREAPLRYGLPEKFALVINQLWAHKNHDVVIDAVARARDRGVRVPVAMIGAPFDYRDRRGRYLSSLLQRIARLDLGADVRLLGEVPFADLVGLLRCAAVVVQPSRWEGWSTTVQDAKALGRPHLCSDLPVLREQAPDALGFFGCDDPDALASLLVDRWASLAPGPDPAGEAEGFRIESAAQTRYGDVILAACREAAG